MTDIRNLQSIQQFFLKEIEEIKIKIKNIVTSNEIWKSKLEKLLNLHMSKTK